MCSATAWIKFLWPCWVSSWGILHPLGYGPAATSCSLPTQAPLLFWCTHIHFVCSTDTGQKGCCGSMQQSWLSQRASGVPPCWDQQLHVQGILPGPPILLSIPHAATTTHSYGSGTVQLLTPHYHWSYMDWGQPGHPMPSTKLHAIWSCPPVHPAAHLWC